MGAMDCSDWNVQLRANVARVRQTIADACRRRDRDPRDVRLVAVTKYVSPAVLREVLAAGVSDIGESQVQQLVVRVRECDPPRLDWPGPAAAPDARPRWHMIGHLQRNKVKLLLPHARIIHSLDSPRLAAALEQQAGPLDAQVDVFIEVNVSGEASKEGVRPDGVVPLITALAACPHLRLRGLMTMAPYAPHPEAARPSFARLRGLLENLRNTGTAGPECVHLSMGMTQDYGVAVEEGATFVRVGSALFAGLPSTDPRAG
jgi:pyridoxal phosphate enzyme (YggS family)